MKVILLLYITYSFACLMIKPLIDYFPITFSFYDSYFAHKNSANVFQLFVVTTEIGFLAAFLLLRLKQIKIMLI